MLLVWWKTDQDCAPPQGLTGGVNQASASSGLKVMGQNAILVLPWLQLAWRYKKVERARWRRQLLQR